MAPGPDLASWKQQAHWPSAHADAALVIFPPRFAAWRPVGHPLTGQPPQRDFGGTKGRSRTDGTGPIAIGAPTDAGQTDIRQ